MHKLEDLQSQIEALARKLFSLKKMIQEAESYTRLEYIKSKNQLIEECASISLFIESSFTQLERENLDAKLVIGAFDEEMIKF